MLTTYVVFKLIWAILLGILFIMLGLMVGMDMGVGILLNFVGRDNVERRTLLNMIGPHWEGNQVWFILGGGAVFAAYPTLYGTSFSVFYVVMILLLFAMILRPVAFDYRSKADNAAWRAVWDKAFFVSGFLPMFIFGVAFGNVLEGVGFHYLWDGQYIQDESFLLYLLNPFAVMCGLLSVTLSIAQGASIIMVNGVGILYDRARSYGAPAALVSALLFIVGGFWIARLKGFEMVGSIDPSMPANPLHGQHVHMVVGAWLENYFRHPVNWIFPAMGVVGMLAQSILIKVNRPGEAWWCGLGIWIGVIFTVGAAMFPFLMPSTTVPNQSLSIWNACGSEYGLICMAILAFVFVPIVLGYTAYCYWVMRGKVTIKGVLSDPHSY